MVDYNDTEVCTDFNYSELILYEYKPMPQHEFLIKNNAHFYDTFV